MPDTARQIAPDALPKAWPFEEAARLAERLGASGKGEAIFETGYGPSGLPHIGTFGEVARTSWVRRAFAELTGLPSRLIAFSDDMDGLRKVPDNVPNREALAAHLGKPLTEVPDPFGTHPSFGAHNNARLQAFLDGFGFEYEFLSSTACYRSGRFDPALRLVAARHAEVVAAVVPTLGPERRAIPSRGASCRWRSSVWMRRLRPYPGAIRRPVRRSRRVSWAVRPSCNGRRIGRCAGWRWASIMR